MPGVRHKCVCVRLSPTRGGRHSRPHAAAQRCPHILPAPIPPDPELWPLQSFIHCLIVRPDTCSAAVSVTSQSQPRGGRRGRLCRRQRRRRRQRPHPRPTLPMFTVPCYSPPPTPAPGPPPRAFWAPPGSISAVGRLRRAALSPARGGACSPAPGTTATCVQSPYDVWDAVASTATAPPGCTGARDMPRLEDSTPARGHPHGAPGLSPARL